MPWICPAHGLVPPADVAPITHDSPHGGEHHTCGSPVALTLETPMTSPTAHPAGEQAVPLAEQCRAEYPRPANVAPNTRIVRCTRRAGHSSAHEETDTEIRWLDPEPSPRTVRLNLPALGGPQYQDTAIEVGGHDVSRATRAGTLRFSVHDPATLELDLWVNWATVDGDIRVEVPPATREALVALGWTPPAEEAAR